MEIEADSIGREVDHGKRDDQGDKKVQKLAEIAESCQAPREKQAGKFEDKMTDFMSSGNNDGNGDEIGGGCRGAEVIGAGPSGKSDDQQFEFIGRVIQGSKVAAGEN